MGLQRSRQEADVSSVGGRARHGRFHGAEITRLSPVTAVDLARPNRQFGNRNVGHSLPVCRKCQIRCGRIAEIRYERSAVVPQHLGSWLPAQSENLLPVPGWNGQPEVQRTVRQLHGLGFWLNPRMPFREYPQAGSAFTQAGEETIFSIRCPSPTTFMRQGVQVRKQRMGMAPVAVEFPAFTQSS